MTCGDGRGAAENSSASWEQRDFAHQQISLQYIHIAAGSLGSHHRHCQHRHQQMGSFRFPKTRQPPSVAQGHA